MAEDDWKKLMEEAYAGDPLSRSLMDEFNARVKALLELDYPLENNPEVVELYADLLMAVRAFVEGRQLIRPQTRIEH